MTTGKQDETKGTDAMPVGIASTDGLGVVNGGRDMEWLYDDPKTNEPGFYAVLYSWDPHEGTFPGHAMWDGTGWLWTSNAAIVACAGPFDDGPSAEAWADEHDPCY